jgi:cellulose synthase/poly-beta-1,6-N-acetylglucosamine synthase-like glycosyltransferase
VSVTSRAAWSERPGKSWLLVVLPFALTAAVLWVVVYPWMQRVDLEDPTFATYARINSVIWLLILWWSLHQLIFQVAALLKVTEPHGPPVFDADASFAIFYLTCDDFDPVACDSCLSQDYHPARFKVLICDDGNDPQIRSEIDRFAAAHPRVRLLRRPDRKGYKAGNLNHAFSSQECGEVDWIVLVDADQSLPGGYLINLGRALADQPEHIAFAQTGHDPWGDDGSTQTTFQEALEAEIRLFYERDLSLRQKCGFLPALGHGLAVRSSSWRALGGFPELVSEDYAFSLAVSSSGLRGIYLEEIRSRETFPKDFNAFVVRLRKFAGGSAELLRKVVWRFLLGRASIVEKVDFMMLILWYPLLPLLLLNGFLSAYVCHRWWALRVSALHPVLPYLFLSMFFLTVPVIVSGTRTSLSAVRYWFWSTAVYSAALPMASWHFVLHLFREPTFERTPKREGETPRLVLASTITAALGVIAIALSLLWWSPFTPVLAAYGAAYSACPIFPALHKQCVVGRLARLIVWMPGTLFLVALYTMWAWAKL